MITLEQLISDDKYSWCEDQTGLMTPDEVRTFLFKEVSDLEKNEEWDSAYEIYREIVFRFNEDMEGWKGLLISAERLGYVDVAGVAAKQVEKYFKNRRRNS